MTAAHPNMEDTALLAGAARPSFAVRVLAFLLPVLAVMAVPAYVLVVGGEMAPLDLDAVARRQANAPDTLLFGPAYTNINKSFKVRAAVQAKPEVLVVGSSRTMQLRASLFPRDVSFYNAGGAISRIAHLRKLLERFPEGSQPHIMMVGLDQWFFDPVTEATYEADFDAQVDAKTDVLGVVQSSWTKLYSDWWAGKFTLGAVAAPRTPAIGLNAIIHANGFRNDGSYLYGEVMRHPNDPSADADRTFALTMERVRAGSTRFEWADHPDRGVIDELARFLDASKKRGVHVIAFLTSYAPRVWKAMRESGHYGFIEEIAPAVRPLFEARGFSFFDFTDLAPLGATDAEFIDGIHAAEYAHLRMMRVMVDGDAELARRTSREHLEALSKRSTGPLSLAEMRVH